MKYQKGSFVVIPNKGIIKGQEPEVQCVYLWICEHANEEGICFPSVTTLSLKSGVSKRKVYECVMKLEELGIIKKTNRKNGKENLTNVYQIMIIDDEGSAQGAGGGSAQRASPSVEIDTTPSAQGAERTQSNYNYNPRTHKKKANAFVRFGKKGSEEAILFNVEMDKMIESSDRTYQIIGAFMSFKEASLRPKIRTRGQLYQFCHRWLKDASILKSWDDKQLNEQFKIADQKYRDIEWTLYTLVKDLTK